MTASAGGLGGTFSFSRQADIQRSLPATLTASETLQVVEGLGIQVDLVSRARVNTEQKLAAARAGRTLAHIAHLGILASAKEGSNAQLVQQVAEVLQPGTAQPQPEIDPIDEKLIEEMALGVRSYNALKRAGALSVRDITKLTREELSNLPNMNEKAVQEVEEELLRLGKSLLSVEDKPPKA